MDYSEKLKKLIDKNNGLILTEDVTNACIPREYLHKFVKSGLLEKLDRGAYITPEAFYDEMYRFQCRYKNIIYSHDTALFFNGLTDRDPIQYTVTVPAGYNSSNLKNIGLKVFSVKKDLFEIGLMASKTTFGRTIRMYDKERAICDAIRSRSQMDVAVITDALKRYVNSNSKNIPKLMRTSESFGVSKILRGYLEVLL